MKKVYLLLVFALVSCGVVEDTDTVQNTKYSITIEQGVRRNSQIEWSYSDNGLTAYHWEYLDTSDDQSLIITGIESGLYKETKIKYCGYPYGKCGQGALTRTPDNEKVVACSVTGAKQKCFLVSDTGKIIKIYEKTVDLNIVYRLFVE